MATAHSYGATLINNKTESEAVRYMLTTDSTLRRPTPNERRYILASLQLTKSFSRAFDLVKVPEGAGEISSVSPEQWKLIELKTTRKKLLGIPDGFFFGATDNEFQLAKLLGDRYAFCFVSLHPDSQNHSYLSFAELEKKIRTKRIQYQINL